MTAEILQICDVGKVQEIKKNIAKVVGLSVCMNGQVLDITSNTKGLVMGFSEGEILTLILGKIEEVKVGQEVYSRQEEFKIPVGEQFLGRIVNALGEQVDGKGPIANTVDRGKLSTNHSPLATNYYPVFREAPGVLERIPVSEVFETGILIIDSTIPIGKGQRQLIIGDRMSGKTTICVDTILNQKGRGIICIYCCVGRSQISLQKIVQVLKENAALDYTIIVSATASSSIGEQYIAPYTAAALGEYFMDRGRDVFVVFDDLTKHAWAYRQISLLLGRSPGRDGYPGDIFYLHSQLMERAGKMRDPEPLPSLSEASPQAGASHPRNDTSKGGSMTFFPIVDTLEGDITAYIPSNLVSMTDGQIYLSSSLFSEGFKPAIDLGLSVSRISNKVQCPAMRQLSEMLRLEYLQYRDLMKMTRFKTGLSEEITLQIRHGEALVQVFIQGKNSLYFLAEELILLHTLKKKIFDAISKENIEYFKKNIMGFCQREFPQLIKDLDREKTLTPEIIKKIDECLIAFSNKELREVNR